MCVCMYGNRHTWFCRAIMKKNTTNEPFEIGQRARIVLLSLLLYVYYTIIAFLSLSLSVSPISSISFRDLGFCFAIAKPVLSRSGRHNALKLGAPGAVSLFFETRRRPRKTRM